MEPNFVIIGAMKAGTTSLWAYLRQHPAVFMPEVKEVDFFSANWEKGWAWYQSHFPAVGRNVRAVGEASTTYSRHPWFPETTNRLAESLPTAKLIYCVRDPLERIRSMYVHCVHMGHERRSFPAAMRDVSVQENDYIAMSSYHYQVQQYLRHFTLERFHFVALEQLRHDPVIVLHALCGYLGIDDTFLFDTSRVHNESRVQRRRRTPLGDMLAATPLERRLVKRLPEAHQRLYRLLVTRPIPRPAFTAEMRGRIIEALQPDVDALRSLTGLGFAEWHM